MPPDAGFLGTPLAKSPFVKFLAASGAAAAVNFGSRFIYSHWVSYAVAVVIAHLTGMCVAYGLSKRFVFTEATRRTAHSMIIFTLVNGLSLGQTVIVSLLLADHVLPALGFGSSSEALGHLGGIGSLVFTSYFAHKHWSFGTSESDPAKQRTLGV